MQFPALRASVGFTFAPASRQRGKLLKACADEEVGRAAIALHAEREVSGLGMEEAFRAKAGDREAVAASLAEQTGG